MRFFSLDFSTRHSRLPLRWLAVAGLASALAACGGGSDGDDNGDGGDGAICKRDATPSTRQLDMRKVTGAADTRPTHIRALLQAASDRVPPHTIILPQLNTAKAAALPAAAPGQPLQLGVARALS
ncbi:MAG: hypothetical protein LBE78_14100, partial [Burkholderiaceae bacterium]|nr:hypothetical protein [Burkholderiaceae bacterium]